jgi:hypothetical protein
MDNMAPAQVFDPYAHGLASGVKDLYEAFLGPPSRPANNQPYRYKPTAKWNMPENYIGQSASLGDTMEDYMFTAEWDWYTERILPWYRTDQIHFQWTEWNNNPHYMGITPHQSGSKVVTQERTIRRASIVRRGIAAEFEHDFVKTPLGRTSFFASLAQMARSVQETANVEVLRALLHCGRFQMNHWRKYKIIKDGDLDEWHRRRAERFMIAQKDEKGLEIMNTYIDRDQEAYGGRANVWILGREVMDYCSLIPPLKTFYFLGGQEAVNRFNGRPENGSAAAGTQGNVRSLQPHRMIGDTPVYLAKSYHVDSIGKAELLSRITEIGVYNTMFDRTIDYTRYRTEGRSIQVYDNDRDDWEILQLAHAIENCHVFDENGELKPLAQGQSRGRHVTIDDHQDNEFDFLSYVTSTGERNNIRYIGDMSVNDLNASNLEHAGRTLLNAIAYHDPQVARELIQAAEQAVAGSGTGYGAPDDGGTKVGKHSGTQFANQLAQALVNIVGSDNLLFAGADSSTHGQILYENLIQYGFAAAKRGAAGHVPVMGGIDVAERRAAAEVRFLTQVLGRGLPSRAADFQAIAERADVPWEERAQQIRAIVVDAVQAQPEQVAGGMDSPAAVDSWYNRNIDDFRRKLASAFPAEEQQRQEQQGAAETRYFAAGSRLPEGWRFVNAGDSQPVGAGMDVNRMPVFAQRAAAAAQVGSHLKGAPGARGAYDRRAAAARDDAARRGAVEGAGNVRVDLSRGGEVNLNANSNIRTHILNLSKTAAPRIIKWLGAIYAMTRFTRQQLLAFANADVYVPLGFLLFRPHCTYKTRFGIKCAANGESGWTMFGHGNMQLTQDGWRKVGLMHYTAYLSAVVMYPKNVYVVEDLFCEKYMGGMGTEFWSPQAYRSATHRRQRSIICAPVPPNFKKVEPKIDIRGRWYTERDMGLVTEDRFDRPLYPGCGRMNMLFGFKDMQRKDRHSSRGRVAINFVCWQGVEFYYNSPRMCYDLFTKEQGCMGEKVYPGCGQVRNGMLRFLETPGYLSQKN